VRQEVRLETPLSKLSSSLLRVQTLLRGLFNCLSNLFAPKRLLNLSLYCQSCSCVALQVRFAVVVPLLQDSLADRPVYKLLIRLRRRLHGEL
jgi:hypothetical protein